MAKPKGNLGTVTIEDAEILWPNFTGRDGGYNQSHSKQFCVVLPEQIARQMAKDGWNVKFPGDAKEEDEDYREPYLQVTLGYKFKPPKVVMITTKGRRYLTEDMVEILDSMEFAHVDMIINPSEWSNASGKSGIKAYLKSLYITIEEDDLERKYADIEEIGAKASDD